MSSDKMEYKMTEEHKKKIGESNRIAMLKFHKENPNFANSGKFKKGQNTWGGKKNLKISGENHPLWKGGVSRGYGKKIVMESGKDMRHCQICNSDEKINIHHINGNSRDNELRNLGVVCTYCHNAMHENGKNARFGNLMIAGGIS